MKILSVFVVLFFSFMMDCHSKERVCTEDNSIPLGAVCLNTQAKPDAIMTYKTIGERTLNLHVFKAHGVVEGNKSPALILFHGGGWNSGTPTQMYDQADYFSKNGVTTISVEYRLWNTDKTPPNVSVMDAKSAYRWVQNNAEKLGIDDKKIAAGGASAGGHLAAALATVSEFNDQKDPVTAIAPAALVLFNPVIDNGPEGYGFERVRPYWRAISPLHNITKGHPPTIVFLGTKDIHIPVATGEAYRDKITAVGSQAELIIYQDKKHGFFNRRRSEDSFTDTVLKAHDFLIKVKFLP